MATRIMLLRAVNVGGAQLPMARLREIATALGARDARTYIASGNLLADVDGEPAAFDRALERAIETEFGFFREVISRTPAQLAEAWEFHPFDVIDPKRSYVNFLLSAPSTDAIAAAREVDTHEDRWDIAAGEMHIRYTQGAGKPEMNVNAIMRSLNVVGTARNLNTVRKLIEMSQGVSQ